jgi:hypothetical protein
MATVTEATSTLWSAPATDLAIIEAVRNDVLYEVVDDKFRELPPMGVEEGVLAATLFRLLSQFAWTAGVGRVVSSDAPTRRRWCHQGDCIIEGLARSLGIGGRFPPLESDGT